MDSRIAMKVVQERLLQNQGIGNASTQIDLESSDIPQNKAATGVCHDRSFASGHHHPGRPQSVTESTIDSQIAIKVVQERIAVRKQMELNENRSTNHLGEPTGNHGAEQETVRSPVPLRTQQSAPGAVRVAGIDAMERDENYDSFNTQQQNNASMPFEPDEPIQAHLVESLQQQQPRPPEDSKILVEAQPMEPDPPADPVALIDAVKTNKRLSCSILAVLAGLVGGALAVGLSVGFAANRKNNSSDERTPLIDPVLPAMTSDLDDTTIETIRTDPLSPEHKANRWVTLDPHLLSYPAERIQVRFFLAATYYATNGDEDWYRNDLWMNYSANECDWYTSHPTSPCDNENGTYAILNLTHNGLTGTMIREMTRHLRILDLSYNKLAGPPPQFTLKHSNMQAVFLNDNQLSGRTMAEIGWISNDLKTLNFANNLLSGTLPAAVVHSAPNLELIDASMNRFVGHLPDLWNRTDLKVFNLADNLLSGTVPLSLSSSTRLEELNLGGNRGVLGSIPSELSELTNLRLLDLSDTSITGSVPEGLCAMSRQQGGPLDIRVDCDQIECCS
ncbi:Leucine-rich repeat-containing protein [Seminavis robusta]|uniref:Leucine-rich repeat-containing protein n=1 Tax=Seminavis robusta TaxID=568900 RepID=A0A9N8DAN5_9STRA|nr:Leucine-rich repeat-containing protein [Seminavis robusta]|eukprot:Sro62_g035550.1 Leucine-rich repeat-containing protein (561) ;mRNA; f:116923-118605